MLERSPRGRQTARAIDALNRVADEFEIERIEEAADNYRKYEARYYQGLGDQLLAKTIPPSEQKHPIQPWITALWMTSVAKRRMEEIAWDNGFIVGGRDNEFTPGALLPYFTDIHDIDIDDDEDEPPDGELVMVSSSEVSATIEGVECVILDAIHIPAPRDTDGNITDVITVYESKDEAPKYHRSTTQK